MRTPIGVAAGAPRGAGSEREDDRTGRGGPDAAARQGGGDGAALGFGPATLAFDPARPETRLAHLQVVNALQAAAGRHDVVRLRLDTRPRAGSRYIDFLIPGLLGLNLLGTGMWGIGFPVANARQLKLLEAHGRHAHATPATTCSP